MRLLQALKDAALILCVLLAVFVVSTGVGYSVVIVTSSATIGILVGSATFLFICITYLAYINND